MNSPPPSTPGSMHSTDTYDSLRNNEKAYQAASQELTRMLRDNTSITNEDKEKMIGLINTMGRVHGISTRRASPDQVETSMVGHRKSNVQRTTSRVKKIKRNRKCKDWNPSMDNFLSPSFPDSTPNDTTTPTSNTSDAMDVESDAAEDSDEDEEHLEEVVAAWSEAQEKSVARVSNRQRMSFIKHQLEKLPDNPEKDKAIDYTRHVNAAVSKTRRTPMSRPMTADAMQGLLMPTSGSGSKTGQDAEQAHPWMKPLKQTPGPLIRTWAENSQGKIRHKNDGMVSGGKGEYLNEHDQRYCAIENHLNYGNRAGTPFISFTTSIEETCSFFVPRKKKSQENKLEDPVVYITIMNPKARIAQGMPLLKMGPEMAFYKVKNPYLGSVADKCIRKYQYLATWNVPQSQIVGTWEIARIEEWMGRRQMEMHSIPAIHNETLWQHHVKFWWREVALPAYEAHEAARQLNQEHVHISGCTCYDCDPIDRKAGCVRPSLQT